MLSLKIILGVQVVTEVFIALNSVMSSDYPNQKKICTAIQEVENDSNTMFVNNIKTSFQSRLSPKEGSKVLKLTGSKCLVNCS